MATANSVANKWANRLNKVAEQPMQEQDLLHKGLEEIGKLLTKEHIKHIAELVSNEVEECKNLGHEYEPDFERVLKEAFKKDEQKAEPTRKNTL
ncbi:hypothetical protein [Burkholderia cenocepacia]|uniref:hypothetical protein n=1 Tax=Burkholderia cenocepacia TaxID=95486 RepID=UPI001B93957F|nr:hypothetical protein [Burkholderia cenocepacia]MBR8480060.1 hypothetical protein [Burkholderia cenocepacia]